MYVFLAILLLSILIAVHEFGHFIAARLTGIAVQEFAIGMGPKIFSWTGKSGTKFSLRWIPMGGFCSFYGEDDVEGKHVDDPRAYSRQSVWKRMLTIVMGPMMNFILALVVSIGFYWTSGVMEVLPQIGELEPGRPAAQAGLQVGDVITHVNGADMREAPAEEIRARIVAGSDPVALTVQRGGEAIEATITPFKDGDIYRIGITFATRTLPMPLGTAIQAGAAYCLEAGTIVITTLSQLFKPEVFDQIAGPVGAVAQVSQLVQESGLVAFISMLVMISVNLGIMNLLPIPGLDGSRFLFTVIEAIRRKPIAPEKEALVHLVGMAFLFAFMIFIVFRDVWRLIM